MYFKEFERELCLNMDLENIVLVGVVGLDNQLIDQP